MSGSDVSSLSSAESIESDEELKSATPRKGTIDRYFQHAKTPQSPLKRKRPASPPHEYVLADNPDIAVRSSGPKLSCNTSLITATRSSL